MAAQSSTGRHGPSPLASGRQYQFSKRELTDDLSALSAQFDLEDQKVEPAPKRPMPSNADFAADVADQTDSIVKVNIQNYNAKAKEEESGKPQHHQQAAAATSPTHLQPLEKPALCGRDELDKKFIPRESFSTKIYQSSSHYSYDNDGKPGIIVPLKFTVQPGLQTHFKAHATSEPNAKFADSRPGMRAMRLHLNKEAEDFVSALYFADPIQVNNSYAAATRTQVKLMKPDFFRMKEQMVGNHSSFLNVSVSEDDYAHIFAVIDNLGGVDVLGRFEPRHMNYAQNSGFANFVFKTHLALF